VAPLAPGWIEVRSVNKARKGVLLVVEDDHDVRLPMRGFLSAKGYDVEEAATIAAAEQVFRRRRPDGVIMDFSLPDGDGLVLLRRLKSLDPSVPAVMLTAHATIDLAVSAIKEGAEQFFTKPVELPALLVILERALENERVRHTSIARKSSEARRAVDPFFGESEAIRSLASQAQKVAGSSVPLLIQGETGTGKGVLARWLHERSSRGEEPFVDINCAGLSKELFESEVFGYEKGAFTGAAGAKPGLLEMAHKGTLFLDEVGEIDVQVQPKLLKVIEELRFRRLGDVRDRQVDVRILAATHRDLPALVAEHRFREDLFYRINAVPLVVPSLRERDRDVVLLARSLMERIGGEIGRSGLSLSKDAETAILAQAWPGNIRQLRNVLERAALLSERSVLEGADLGLERGAAAASAPSYPATQTLEDVEKAHIEAVLKGEDWVMPRTAKVLGLSRSALYHKLKKHRIPLRKPS
jgi:DNA-binding NtrC family response regulator